MLPHAYGLPAAVFLVLGGAVACFAGYRLFRIVLGIYGFILGATLASSIVGTSNTVGMVVTALLGGLAGAAVLVLAYFVGIALVGAGLGALVVHLFWNQVWTADPPAMAVITASIAGALVAMILQRYVIVVSTAFGGAWTAVLGLVNALEPRGLTRGSSATEVWILYPTTVPTGRWLIAWLVLGLVGTLVQLRVTARKKK